jgi:predicted RNase H-like nuclease (RuvC/YqgF family)
MSDLVFAAVITGGFGVVIEILRRLLSQNRKDHDHVIVQIADLATQSKDTRNTVYNIAADVRDVKADVRELKRDHAQLEQRVDQFDK